MSPETRLGEVPEPWLNEMLGVLRADRRSYPLERLTKESVRIQQACASGRLPAQVAYELLGEWVAEQEQQEKAGCVRHVLVMSVLATVVCLLELRC